MSMPHSDDALATLLPFPIAPAGTAGEAGDQRAAAGEPRPPAVRDASEVEPAGLVLDAEIVQDTPNLPALPTPPVVLPAWLADRRTSLATVRWAGRYATRHAGFHALRAPVYGLTIAWWVTRGVVIGAGRGAGWMFATSHTPMIRDAMIAADWDKTRGLISERGHHIRRRLKITAVGVLVTTVGVTVGTLTVGTWIAWLIGAMLAVGAGVLGKPKNAHIVVDAGPTLPTQISLNAEMLTEALRAAGLLKPGAAPVLVSPILRDRNDKGWEAMFDLPRGGGKTAADVLAKRDVLAAELGVDEIQIIMTRIRASAGGNAARLRLWVADDDPYLGPPTPSPLITATQFCVWDPIPFGHDAQGRRITLSLLWQSMFFGGLPRRGKTFAQRIPSAAGVLDPHVRHYVADGKGGGDWKPMRAVAHRLVIGADDEQLTQFKQMLTELIAEMSRRFAVIGTLPASVCPEGKLTPEISKRYEMPIIFVTIDELQEYLSAMEKEDRDDVVNQLCRLARRASGRVHPERRESAAGRGERADQVPGDHHLSLLHPGCRSHQLGHGVGQGESRAGRGRVDLVRGTQGCGGVGDRAGFVRDPALRLHRPPHLRGDLRSGACAAGAGGHADRAGGRGRDSRGARRRGHDPPGARRCAAGHARCRSHVDRNDPVPVGQRRRGRLQRLDRRNARRRIGPRWGGPHRKTGQDRRREPGRLSARRSGSGHSRRRDPAPGSGEPRYLTPSLPPVYPARPSSPG